MTPRTLAAVVFALAASAGLGACGGSSDSAPTPTPTATATATRSPTATPTATHTATPDPLGPQPKTAEDAEDGLARYRAMNATNDEPRACLGQVLASWGGTCEENDIDGDGETDAAYLIPLQGGRGLSRAPGVVLVVRSGSPDVERFPLRNDADVSELGLDLFSLEDRSGDAQVEVTYLSTQCGASNCVSQLEVQTWDGTAWRDIGPGPPGWDNPESIEWVGPGDGFRLVVRAGELGSLGAGPTRVSTSTYVLRDGAYQLDSREPDPPVYLFHAVLDADALFDTAQFRASIEAYRAAIESSDLRDWKAEVDRGEGRPFLVGYALFRIAVATAASGQDPTIAIDEVITSSPEPLFVEAVQAFRRGFQEGNSVSRGCVEATRYFATPAAAAIIDEQFDYGYGNPRKAPADMCPLG